MLDIAYGIWKLIPGAQYRGSVSENTKAEFDSLEWMDERPKPTWAQVQAAGTPPPEPPDLNEVIDALLSGDQTKIKSAKTRREAAKG